MFDTDPHQRRPASESASARIMTSAVSDSLSTAMSRSSSICPNAEPRRARLEESCGHSCKYGAALAPRARMNSADIAVVGRAVRRWPQAAVARASDRALAVPDVRICPALLSSCMVISESAASNASQAAPTCAPSSAWSNSPARGLRTAHGRRHFPSRRSAPTSRCHGDSHTRCPPH